jgi:regulator of sirC expression with transglutaminase-like and TPR domain
MHLLRPLLALIFLSYTPEKVSVLYRSLDPQSIAQHLAFYHLFPKSPEGKCALNDAWQLLNLGAQETAPLSNIPESSIHALIALMTQGEGKETPVLNPGELATIARIAQHLPNRRLKGYHAESETELLSLPAEEIDLAHALFCAQSADDPSMFDKMQSYEALLDLMALQILTQVKLTDPPELKIRALNRFIFEEMGFRFPPHSVYVKDVDLYTYLSSVVDLRRGVCLGVSTLYLCLSQRLDLSLEAVTPPGHIYIRYHTPEKTINIETTARGIHLDTEEYQGIESADLPLRTIKEVVGLSYFNAASVHWQNEDYQRSLKCYQKALLYMPDDPLLQELMGYNYLFLGELEKGANLIRSVYSNSQRNHHQVALDSVVEDFLNGKTDGEGIRVLFLHVDENRSSLLAKKEALENTLKLWPSFRAAQFQLGVVWLQLHRQGEALMAFQAYERLEPNDPSAEYILAGLSASRSLYPDAWDHLHNAEKLIKMLRDDIPKSLKELRRELAARVPE